MLTNDVCSLEASELPGILFKYRHTHAGLVIPIGGPVFCIDGKRAVIAGLTQPTAEIAHLTNGVREARFSFAVDGFADLTLTLVMQMSPANPIVRFRYALTSIGTHRLTKRAGRDALDYLSISLAAFPKLKEVRFSEFLELAHSFCLAEAEITDAQVENGLSLMGPMLTGFAERVSFLTAYEHGSQFPDRYLQYRLAPDRSAQLQAVKGNYHDGFLLTDGHPFDSVWFQLGAVDGDEDALAAAYRAFVLHYQSNNLESRKPYIYYNTWNFQERNHAWHGQPYLASMTPERMLAEIDVAHRMGIEVFVLDTGWFIKTGDWKVNTQRFPDALAAIRQKLDGYGMKLGLWFNPVAAAGTSRIWETFPHCAQAVDGVIDGPNPIWESEPSYPMCLVSDYADAFADELVRIVREWGVTYFKWDAIQQYGCNDPRHLHGGLENTATDRAECYAFEQGRAMTRIVDKVCAACPGAIVDFDITEGHRFVGLSFLAAGKYFLINNGPYSASFNFPPPTDGNVNLFFYPGPARAWICRLPLGFDKWIPSVLFLTHYLPDDPASSQMINVASLILGQNGIWGDLLSVSGEGADLIGHLLSLYKQVRHDITESSPVRQGVVSGSPEIYEKINPASGRGAVVVFASAPGTYAYITKRKPDRRVWHTEGVNVRWTEAGEVLLEVTFQAVGAQIVFFGVEAD